MVTLVKHEWHQTDRQFCIEIDDAILAEIYPDLDDDEIAEKLQQLADGEIDVEDIVNDAYDNDVDLEWEHQYDDCWTDRKGGYDVTYELGDEDSYHHEPEPAPHTHKCTKCKWTGQSYDAHWKYPEDEDSKEEPTKICPYCESATELTEAGVEEERKRQERMARWAAEDEDEEDEDEEVNEPDAELIAQLEELKREFDLLMTEEEVPCFSCGELHLESELPELNGQYHCPSCHEGWIMSDAREENEDE
jgi:Zn finger protein HypA/HybF involved in hydrogenase expression